MQWHSMKCKGMYIELYRCIWQLWQFQWVDLVFFQPRQDEAGRNRGGGPW